MTARYERQVALFGRAGQERIRATHVVQLGAGGLGMHVIQQLAYLGVPLWTVVDSKVVSETNLNRLVGAQPEDIGTLKVAIAERLIRRVQHDAIVTALDVDLPDPAITTAIASAHLVIGAFDREEPRLRALDLCSSNGIPYIDVATEVISPTKGAPIFGGHVVVSHDGTGCLDCLDLIDRRELAREQMPDSLKPVHDANYGIERDDLAGSGPSVISLNGVIASLAVTEVMCLLTGIRTPHRHLTYRGDLGWVTINTQRGRKRCPFCTRWRLPHAV
jgi:molybdopterin-synthase adenylyltransferase